MNRTTLSLQREKPCIPSTGVSGAQAVIESLLEEGIDTIFGYPGGTIMPVYDALYDYRDRIRHILVRHEQGAIHAAQGYARVSGKVGVCFVTSGPGATNTVTGLADALMDSTPIVVISGQVSSRLLGTDAFQETNFIGITQAVTKWNCQVKQAADIPAAIAKAFYIARSGRPGPVVVDITKDAQQEITAFHYPKISGIRSYMPYPQPDEAQIAAAARLINFARKPLALVGQGVLLGHAERELLDFLQKSGIPAASTLLGLSAIPTKHPQYVGMLGMHGNYAPNIKNKECDLLLAIGMRFDDRVTGDPEKFGINAKIIHMEIDPAEINKIIYADIPVIGNVKETLPMLTNRIIKKNHPKWLAEFQACYHIEYQEIIEKELFPEAPFLRMGRSGTPGIQSLSGQCHFSDGRRTTTNDSFPLFPFHAKPQPGNLRRIGYHGLRTSCRHRSQNRNARTRGMPFRRRRGISNELTGIGNYFSIPYSDKNYTVEQ